MELKYIIKEELKKGILNENILSDLSSKFNISEIKKLLKEKLGIDENSTKLDISKKLMKYYYNLNLKMLKYELGAVLGYFIFYLLSVFLDVRSRTIYYKRRTWYATFYFMGSGSYFRCI